MASFCAKTCRRCGSGDWIEPGTPPDSAVPTAPKPATPATPSNTTALPTALPGGVAAYGKVRRGGAGGVLEAQICRQLSVPAHTPPPLSPLPPQALELSWRFYYAQRSGKLSSGTNPIAWRGDSHLQDPVVGGCVCGGGWGVGGAARTSPLVNQPRSHTNPKPPPLVLPPPTPRFYDAGDHLKLNFPLAHSLALLAWGVVDFPAGYAAAGQAAAALDNLRWVRWRGGRGGSLHWCAACLTGLTLARQAALTTSFLTYLTTSRPPTHPLHPHPTHRQGADYLMACHTSDSTYIAQIGNPGPGAWVL